MFGLTLLWYTVCMNFAQKKWPLWRGSPKHSNDVMSFHHVWLWSLWSVIIIITIIIIIIIIITTTLIFIIITNKHCHWVLLIFGGFHSLAKSVQIEGFLTHLSFVKVVWKILHSICSDNVNVLIFAWVSFPQSCYSVTHIVTDLDLKKQ